MMLVTIAKGEQIPIPIKINIPLFSRSVAIQIWGKGEGREKTKKRKEENKEGRSFQQEMRKGDRERGNGRRGQAGCKMEGEKRAKRGLGKGEERREEWQEKRKKTQRQEGLFVG